MVFSLRVFIYFLLDCVCVCVRKKERERERQWGTKGERQRDKSKIINFITSSVRWPFVSSYKLHLSSIPVVFRCLAWSRNVDNNYFYYCHEIPCPLHVLPNLLFLDIRSRLMKPCWPWGSLLWSTIINFPRQFVLSVSLTCITTR